MSITIVHDYYFKPGGDVAEGKAAAAEFAAYLKTLPAVQLTLWLEDRENPLHHFHINIFDSITAFEDAVDKSVLRRFTERLYPHIARSTHTAPVCDVWMAQGHGFNTINYPS